MRFDTIIRNGTVVTATDTFLADVGIAGEKNSAVEVLLLPESVRPLLVDFGSLGRVTDGYGRERIEKTRREEQSLAAKAKREAAEQARADKVFARKARQAKRAKDARAFGTLLRLRNVLEGSPEWKNAWKFFYS